MIKKEDVVNLSKKDVEKKVNELKKKMLSLKLQASVSGLEKPHELKILRKDIARILTFASNK